MKIKKFYLPQFLFLFLCLTINTTAQNNPDFFVDNGTCKCPDANFGDTGTLTMNGQQKTFTKRTLGQLDAIIANDVQDPEIALTCTSGITDMSSLFAFKTTFNQNIEHWDVSNVTNMSQMFIGYSIDPHTFNQPLNNWDVSNVTEMQGMFANATFFNQSLGNWDVSNVLDMRSMFYTAKSFDRDISSWDFNQNVEIIDFLNNCGLSTSNYDLLLEAFNNKNLVDKDLGAVSVAYCDESTRNSLVNNKNFMIKGDVLGQCGTTFNPSTIPFVTTWTVQQGELDIEVFTIQAYNYDFTVDWGDGQIDQNVNADITHTYSSAGTYTVSITGVFPYFKTCNISNGFNINCNNSTKLTSVESWGNQEWRYMLGSFNSAENFNLNATQPPNLTNVRSLRDTFREAEIFQQNINNWDVSNVTDMSGTFYGATSFDQPLNNWDVSNVKDMSDMFSFAESFNQPLNNWDVSNVKDMSDMFGVAEEFNQPIDNWDVSKVKDMDNMFAYAESFNQSINNWNVSNVIDMRSMFDGAIAFNKSLNDWDVSNVTDMGDMFYYATSFNQPLSNWDVSNVTNMVYMFNDANSFNQPLNNWVVSNVTNMSGMFGYAESFNQPLNNWDVSNVIYMNFMFNNSINFNQDISSWCVEQIPTEPQSFATNNALQASFFPDWGATCTLGLAENSLDNFKVYSNPVESQLNLSWSSVNFPDEMNIQLYNLSGKKVFEQSYSQKPSELDISPLSSGVYLIKVKVGDQSTVRQIVKK